MAAINIDFEPVKVAIFDWLHTALNGALAEGAAGAIPVLRAEQNSTRPHDQLYVEYKFLTSFLKINPIDDLVWDEANSQFKLVGQREFVVSCHFIGEGAAECAAGAQMALSAPNICQIFRGNGMAVRNDRAINDTTQYLEEAFEPRAVLDVRFGLTLENLSIVSDLGTIESVELKNKIIDATAGGPFTVVITKP